MKQVKVSFCTLGCKVNQYESEAMAEMLASEGIDIVPFGEKCDAYIINTCAVTAEAERKSCQMIRRAFSHNPDAYIAVTGCVAQLFPDKILKIPGTCFVTGNTNKMLAAAKVASFLRDGKTQKGDEEKKELRQKAAEAEGLNGRTTFGSLRNADTTQFEAMSVSHCDRTRAYIKIEDGCDHACSYCIIPHARGNVRSRAVPDIVNEARSLVATGYSEIVLCGIEISAYGKDIGCRLLDLLAELDNVEGLRRIRLGSLDPFMLRKDFIDGLSAMKHLAPHIHLSLQSGCDRTLAAMRRRNTAASVYESVRYAREKIPGISFTADVIVGFPAESEEDFLQSARLIESLGLLDFHIFAFSPRPGTPAAQMKCRVDKETKKRRERYLEKIRAKSKNEFLSQYTGKDVEVLFEELTGGYMRGHTANFCEVEVPADALRDALGVCPEALRGTYLTVNVLKASDGALSATVFSRRAPV